jgi:hypothetical protein
MPHKPLSPQTLAEMETVPDLYERSQTLKRWLQEYDIEIGEYSSTGSITVMVAGATIVEKTSGFPSVDLYVKIAFAVNGGCVERRDRFRGDIMFIDRNVFVWDGVNWFSPMLER